jgi:hypothetical protein
MINFNQFITIISLILCLNLSAGDKKRSVKRQETRLPGILAGAEPTAAKQTKTSLAQPKLHTIIKAARAQIGITFDKNCSECVTLAKNNLLLENPVFTYCLTCLELMKTMPEQRFSQAVGRFQADGLALHLSPATIRKACELWHYKPQQCCQAHRGLAKEKTEKKRAK